MIQLFYHTGRQSAIPQYCEQALSTLLTDNLHRDGSFETWIIPERQRTPKQERHFAYTRTIWGNGPDVDVMANLLYALTLYDPTRFAEIIRRGTAYIEEHQQADGSWLSTWYHGPYYGTFVCTRLLAREKPDSPCLARARTFLLQHQLLDGGWAMDGSQGDPLSTALALLSLSTSGQLQEHHTCPSIEKALRYLQHSYDTTEQSWPRCEFIHGRLSEKVTEVLPYSYGSRTITTAFVLKAAMAWKEWETRLERAG